MQANCRAAVLHQLEARILHVPWLSSDGTQFIGDASTDPQARTLPGMNEDELPELSARIWKPASGVGAFSLLRLQTVSGIP